MYEYKFVRINYKESRKSRESYQDVINQHSELGWRFIQIFAPPIRSYGLAAYYELIFEKRKQDI
ncbi:DUF4177 domain-containing protein [Peribacillus frigoritolerans]|uniref:DUF4177 domain-containing protein n=1 Tax=Peribacillus frigoritolerans TaxID=450367 RepID=UPI002E1CFD68|nr:DUF4177 domain-containing protein [Peribacillus frigoritolerans]